MGQFDVRLDSGVRCDLGSHKAEELFAFLVLRRGKPCGRDFVAELLWDDASTQARKYLRHALWQVNRGLAAAGLERLLHADHEWLQLAHDGLRVDLLIVEDASQRHFGRVGHEISADGAASLESAALLFEGDLMDGWPGSWLADERERIRAVYLGLAEKLCDHYESQGRVDAALAWSERILVVDPAHERSHRRSMRIRYSAGDRTGALRQFQRCSSVLSRELDVVPSPDTMALMLKIRAAEQLPDGHALPACIPVHVPADAPNAAGPTAIARLGACADRLRSLASDFDREIASVFDQGGSIRRVEGD